MKKFILENGLVITKIIIWKASNLSDDNGRDNYIEYRCDIKFSNNNTISTFLDENDCKELSDAKYTRGIYEYINDEYKQIEDWEN